VRSWVGEANVKTARGEAKQGAGEAEFFFAMALAAFGGGDDVVAKTYQFRTCSIGEGHMMEWSINCVARRVVFVLFDVFDDINSSRAVLIPPLLSNIIYSNSLEPSKCSFDRGRVVIMSHRTVPPASPASLRAISA
jgi:hypothetical protein